MSVQTATNRFIVPPNEKSLRLYQELLTGVLSYEQLSNKLIVLSEHARAVRQWDNLSELAAILINYPLKDYQAIGQYYYGLSLCQNGVGELYKAQIVLENVACNAPSKYRAEAMLSLSAISWVNNKPEETIKHCLEAGKLGQFNMTTLQGLKGIAVLKGRMGDHKPALIDLENLHLLMRHAPSHIYFDYLNSLAVELGEVGQKGEARNIIQHVLASPFAKAYPEWLQTAQDLRGKNRSFAVIRPTRIRKGKLLTMPIPEHGEVEELDRPARVINLRQWKIKMGKDDTPNDRTPNEKLDDRELTLRIFQLVATRERTEAEL